MPQPGERGIALNPSPVLTNMAMNFLPALSPNGTTPGGFIARTLLPNLPVAAPDGTYNILNRESFMRLEAKSLANNEAAPIGGFNFDVGNYSTNEYGIAANYTDRELARAQTNGVGAAGLIRAKTYYVTLQSLMRLEKDTSDMMRTGANWNVTLDGVAAAPGGGQTLKWSAAASDPVGFIKDQKLALQLATGFPVNTIIIPPTVLRWLTEHPDLIDRVKYSGSTNSPAKVNLSSIADLLEIDRILVPTGQYNTGVEGAADVIAWFWGNDVWMGYMSDMPSTEQPSAGYRISWTGQQGTGPQPFQTAINEDGLFVRRYTENRPPAYFVESRYYTIPKVTGSALGALFTNMI